MEKLNKNLKTLKHNYKVTKSTKKLYLSGVSLYNRVDVRFHG